MTYSPSRLSDLNRLRRAFWEFSAAAEPAFVARTERGNESSRWLPVGALPLVLVHYFWTRGVGVFVRGARGTRIGHVRELSIGREWGPWIGVQTGPLCGARG